MVFHEETTAWDKKFELHGTKTQKLLTRISSARASTVTASTVHALRENIAELVVLGEANFGCDRGNQNLPRHRLVQREALTLSPTNLLMEEQSEISKN